MGSRSVCVRPKETLFYLVIHEKGEVIRIGLNGQLKVNVSVFFYYKVKRKLTICLRGKRNKNKPQINRNLTYRRELQY